MANNDKQAVTTTGRFYWHELSTPDLGAAKAFYGELFGWVTREMDMGPMGTYTVVSAGKTDVGGIAVGKGNASWLAYTTAHDVDAAAARAKKLGATVEVPATDIPGVGRFAIVRGHDGARIAPFRPVDERADEPTTPAVGEFCWNELITDDPETALGLYSGLFGYSHVARDMGPLGTYTMLMRGERQAGGVMKSMKPGNPSHWLNYVVVPDVDAGFARASKLKGKQLMPPMDIPGIGRFAVVEDPSGASIALFKG